MKREIVQEVLKIQHKVQRKKEASDIGSLYFHPCLLLGKLALALYLGPAVCGCNP